ncbi:uncharacterized protein LOC143632401 isoform X2 [Bidens hawaiensis]|uniref:uncharacterized protein LOC143632401 isoform X2 n=1 Tax=Bidens hawaiensis TaxID=980011 RepID=UPI00404ABDA1
MFDQEIMFKNQVHEMHRLYAVQKLVKGDPRYPRCELFPMRTTFTESQPVGPTRFIFDQGFGSRIQHVPLDLRLSTGNSCDDDVLDLSLSIGMSSNKRIKSLKKSPPVIIDLEDSTETGSNESLKVNLPQGSSGWRDAKRKFLMNLDLNKDQPDEYPSCDELSGVSSSQLTTSLTFKSQTRTHIIDLESLPEPSSDLTEENIINVSSDLTEENIINASSDLTEENIINVLETSKQDDEEENAALSLICISKQHTSTINQDSDTRSIDSYESLVLKLEESITDQDSVTSKTYEINELENKESVIKLRRGRRLKDFQKDILPTLSSLSKHEIWEDIKLLEGVIRSREYKRLNKAKMLTPVKSKRSKVNSTSQKTCLKRKL